MKTYIIIVSINFSLCRITESLFRNIIERLICGTLRVVYVRIFFSISDSRLPNALQYPASVSMDGSLYLIGGSFSPTNGVHLSVRAIYRFDGGKFEWERMGGESRLLGTKNMVAAFQVDSRLFPRKCPT